MRFVALFYLTLSSVIAADGETIRAFGHTWTVPIASDWKIEEGQVPVLHLAVPRPQTQPRRPKQFALAETPPGKTLP